MIEPAAIQGLNWGWIVLGATVPMLAGLIVAWPIWAGGQPILGNLAGTAIIFGSAVALILREHAAIDRVVQACLAAGTTCWPEPGAFTRFAIYAFVGLAQVMALFTPSVSVETRQRRKRHAPEWR